MPSELSDEFPTLAEVTSNPRFKALDDFGRKKTVLERYFAEAEQFYPGAGRDLPAVESIVRLRHEEESAAPVAKRLLEARREDESFNLALTRDVRLGKVDQADAEARIAERKGKNAERDTGIEAARQLFSEDKQEEVAAAFAELDGRARDAAVFVPLRFTDSVKDWLGVSEQSLEERKAIYDETRNNIAAKYGLKPEEVEDVLKHRFDAQEEPVSRDAFGQVHYKTDLLFKGEDEIKKAIEASDLGGRVKRSEIAAIPEQLARFKSSVVESTLKNHPALSEEIGLEHTPKSDDPDYQKVIDENYRLIGEDVSESRLGNELNAAGSAAFRTGADLTRLAGSVLQRGLASAAEVPWEESRKQSQMGEDTANELDVVREGLESRVALSNALNGEKLKIFGASGGVVGQGAYSIMESAALAAATGPLAPEISAARIANMGKAGQRLATAFNAVSKVAPVGGITGVRQGFDVYEQAKELNLSDEKATELAWTSGVIEAATTMAFSGLGAGGVEDIASGAGREALRQSLRQSAKNAWVAGAKAFAGGTLGELAEEETINLLDTALVRTELNPDMTVDEFKQSVRDTAIATLLPSSVLSGLHARNAFVEAKRTNPGAPVALQDTPELQERADAILERELSVNEATRDGSPLRAFDIEAAALDGDEIEAAPVTPPVEVEETAVSVEIATDVPETEITESADAAVEEPAGGLIPADPESTRESMDESTSDAPVEENDPSRPDETLAVAERGSEEVPPAPPSNETPKPAAQPAPFEVISALQEPKPKRKSKGPSEFELAENYFRPGREIEGYGGRDEVVSFQKEGDQWSVTVKAADGRDDRVRTHSTLPKRHVLEKAWNERQTEIPPPIRENSPVETKPDIGLETSLVSTTSGKPITESLTDIARRTRDLRGVKNNAGKFNAVVTELSAILGESDVERIASRIQEATRATIARMGEAGSLPGFDESSRTDLETPAVAAAMGTLLVRIARNPDSDIEAILRDNLAMRNGLIGDRYVRRAAEETMRRIEDDAMGRREDIGERQLSDASSEPISPDSAIETAADMLSSSGEISIERAEEILSKVASKVRGPSSEMQALAADYARAFKSLPPEVGKQLREWIKVSGIASEPSPYAGIGRATMDYTADPSGPFYAGTPGDIYLRLRNGGEPVTYLRPDSVGMREMVAVAEEVFGAQVLIYRGAFDGDLHSVLPDGWYDAAEGVVYVNADSSRPIPLIVGHEGAHHLQVQRPQLYREIVSKLTDVGILSDAYAGYSSFIEGRGYAPDQFFTEYMADVIGRGFEDAMSLNRFRDILGPDNRSLFKRFLDAIREVFSPFVSAMRDLAAGMLGKRDRDALRTLESSWQAMSVIEDALNRHDALSSADRPVFYVPEADYDMYRFLRVREKLEGEEFPNASVFASERPRAGRRNINGPAKNGDYVVNADELMQVSVSALRNMDDGMISGLLRGKTTFASVSALIGRFSQDAQGALEAVRIAVENDHSLGRFDGSQFIAAAGIKAVVMQQIAKIPSRADREELFNAMWESRVNAILDDPVDLNLAIRRGAQMLHVFGQMGQGAGWRNFAGLTPVEVGIAQQALVDGAIGSREASDLRQAINDPKSPSSDKRLSDRVAEEIGNTGEKASRDNITIYKRSMAEMARLSADLLKFVRSLQSQGYASERADNAAKPSSLDAIARSLERIVALGENVARSNDEATIIRQTEEALAVMKTISFGEVDKRFNTKAREVKEKLEKATRETRKKVDRTHDETDGEFANPAEKFLYQKKNRAIAGRRNAPSLRDIADFSAAFNPVMAKFRGEEINLDTAVKRILDNPLFGGVESKLVRDTLVQSKKQSEAVAAAMKSQTAKRKIASAEVAQINARRRIKERRVPDATKQALQRTARRVAAEQMTTDEAVTEISQSHPSVPEGMVRDFIREAVITRNLANARKLDTTLDRNVGEDLSWGGKILRQLGFGEFHDGQGTAWDKLDAAGKKKALRESSLVPANLKTDTAIDQLVASVEGITDIEEAIDALDAARKEFNPVRPLSFYKWLEGKIKTDKRFDFAKPSRKPEIIAEWLRSERNQPELAAAMARELGKEPGATLTDADSAGLQQKAFKRFQEAVNKIAIDTAVELIDGFEGKKGITEDMIRKAIRLKLLDRSVNTDYALGTALGNEFRIPYSAQEEISRHLDTLDRLTELGLNNIDAYHDVQEKIDRVLRRNVAKYGPKVSKVIRTGITASMYSSYSTMLALPLAGGAASLTSAVSRAMIDIVAVNRSKAKTTVGEDLGNFVQSLLLATGISFTPDGRLSASGVFASAKSGFIRGTNSGNFMSIDSTGGSSESLVRDKDVLVQQIQRLTDLVSDIRKREGGEKFTKADAHRAVRDVTLGILSIFNAPVFRIMSSVDNVFQDLSVKLMAMSDASGWVRDGLISQADFRTVIENAQKKARGAYETLRGEFPDMSESDLRRNANQIAFRNMFDALANEYSIEDAAQAWEVALFEHTGISGNSGEVRGFFTQLSKSITRFLEGWLDTRASDPAWKNNLKLAASFSLVFNKVIISASTNFDTISWYAPGAYFVFRHIAGNITPEMRKRASFLNGMALGYEKSMRNPTQLRKRKQDAVFGLLMFSAFTILQNVLDDDDEERFFVQLGYPKDQREREEFEIKQRSEYTAYIKPFKGMPTVAIEFGRGAFPQITGPAVVAQRMKNILEGLVSTEKETRVSQEISGMVGDMFVLGNPFISSIFESRDKFDDERALRKQAQQYASYLVPLRGLASSTDRLMRGRTVFAEGASPLAIFPQLTMWGGISEDHRVPVFDGFGRPLTNRTDVWGNLRELRSPILLMDDSPRGLTPEETKAIEFFDRVGYFPSSRPTYKRWISDKGMFTDDDWKKLFEKNRVTSKGQLYEQFTRENYKFLARMLIRGMDARNTFGVRQSLSDLEREIAAARRTPGAVPEVAKRVERFHDLLDKKISEMRKKNSADLSARFGFTTVRRERTKAIGK